MEIAGVEILWQLHLFGGRRRGDNVALIHCESGRSGCREESWNSRLIPMEALPVFNVRTQKSKQYPAH